MWDCVYLQQDSISHRDLSPVALKNATQQFCASPHWKCVHELVCVMEIRLVVCVTECHVFIRTWEIFAVVCKICRDEGQNVMRGVLLSVCVINFCFANFVCSICTLKLFADFLFYCITLCVWLRRLYCTCCLWSDDFWWMPQCWYFYKCSALSCQILPQVGCVSLLSYSIWSKSFLTECEVKAGAA